MINNEHTSTLPFSAANASIAEAAFAFQAGQPITALAYLHRAASDLEWATSATVYAARAEGTTWAQIGAALKTSKQAVQQKYGRAALEGWDRPTTDAEWADQLNPA